MISVKNRSLQSWVEDQMQRGRYTFTRDDAQSVLASSAGNYVSVSLSRLVSRGVIMSPWQNFYVAIPTEYKLRSIVPPSFYIDRLMHYLRREYYVSLLSAAEFNGASHQREMLFQVTMNGGCIRSAVKNGTRLDFTLRQQLPMAFTKKIKTQMGYMNVAGAELTALDLVAEQHKVGGLSRVAEMLVELCEKTQWDEQTLPLLSIFSIASIQRLGYLLEKIEEEQQADNLYALTKKVGKTMRTIPLKQNVGYDRTMPFNKRWKIIENYELEIDEI